MIHILDSTKETFSITHAMNTANNLSVDWYYTRRLFSGERLEHLAKKSHGNNNLTAIQDDLIHIVVELPLESAPESTWKSLAHLLGRRARVSRTTTLTSLQHEMIKVLLNSDYILFSKLNVTQIQLMYASYMYVLEHTQKPTTYIRQWLQT